MCLGHSFHSDAEDISLIRNVVSLPIYEAICSGVRKILVNLFDIHRTVQRSDKFL